MKTLSSKIPFSINCFKTIVAFFLKKSLSKRAAGVIDCWLGKTSHNSVVLGLNSGITLITFPDNKSLDISRQDFTAKRGFLWYHNKLKIHIS